MKRHGWFAGSVGVLALSVGLLLLTDSASYGSATRNWDTNNPSATRFTVLFGGQAVRDNNTGLVWEQAPTAILLGQLTQRHSCAIRTVGGTVGWRLPSVIELTSLMNPSLGAPFVPASVFTNVQLGHYWSATRLADSPSGAWGVGFGDGIPGAFDQSVGFYGWCVRGGMNADAY